MQHHGDIITSVGAGAAVISPWWLPVLREWSEVAGYMLPFLGCAWLLMQMSYWLYKRYKGR